MNTNIIIVLLIVIFVAILLLIPGKKSPLYTLFAGLRGEHTVSRELHRLGEKYIILNDLMIKTSHGTCQIDHIVLSPYSSRYVSQERSRYVPAVTLLTHPHPPDSYKGGVCLVHCTVLAYINLL